MEIVFTSKDIDDFLEATQYGWWRGLVYEDEKYRVEKLNNVLEKMEKQRNAEESQSRTNLNQSNSKPDSCFSARQKNPCTDNGGPDIRKSASDVSLSSPYFDKSASNVNKSPVKLNKVLIVDLGAEDEASSVINEGTPLLHESAANDNINNANESKPSTDSKLNARKSKSRVGPMPSKKKVSYASFKDPEAVSQSASNTTIENDPNYNTSYAKLKQDSSDLSLPPRINIETVAEESFSDRRTLLGNKTEKSIPKVYTNSQETKSQSVDDEKETRQATDDEKETGSQNKDDEESQTKDDEEAESEVRDQSQRTRSGNIRLYVYVRFD